MKAIDAIFNRRSIRKFEDKVIPKETIEKIKPIVKKMDKYNKQFMKIIKMLFKFNIMQIKVIMKKIINKEKIPILLFSKSFLLKEICVDTQIIK